MRSVPFVFWFFTYPGIHVCPVCVVSRMYLQIKVLILFGGMPSFITSKAIFTRMSKIKTVQR